MKKQAYLKKHINGTTYVLIEKCINEKTYVKAKLEIRFFVLFLELIVMTVVMGE